MDRNGEEPPRDEENDLTRISNRELVDLCSQGNRAAWDEAYRRFTPLIRKIAGKYWMKPHYVEDVVQETFIEFAGIMNKGKFDHSRGAPSALLGTIARNICVDYYKKYGRERFEDDIESYEWKPVTAEPSGDRPDRLLEKWQLIDHVRAALKSLDEVCQELLWLRYHEGAPYAEIVASRGRSVGAWREQARRCRKTLRDMLKSRGVSLP